MLHEALPQSLMTYVKKCKIKKYNRNTKLAHKMSLPATFDLTEEDAQLLLAANVHLGHKNVQVC